MAADMSCDVLRQAGDVEAFDDFDDLWLAAQSAEMSPQEGQMPHDAT